MKPVAVLFIYDKAIDKRWLQRTVERVSQRLEASAGLTIRARYERHDLQPRFAEYEPETKTIERWIPFSWMRENVGPLTRGEHAAMLCLNRKRWPSDSIVAGRCEYSPYNGQTYLIHLRAEKGEKRGKYELAEDSIFHELLHTFEAQTGHFHIVHKNVNDLEAAARELKVILDRSASLAATIAILTKQIAALLRR
jgi:hypothetical protein